MAEKILENHKIVTTEHEMRIDGHYLSEKKQKSVIEPNDGGKTGLSTILVHVRTIDSRCYKVTVVEKQDDQDQTEKTIDTEMTEEEIEIFEHDWTELWGNPRLRFSRL